MRPDLFLVARVTPEKLGARRILGKTITVDADRRHYSREITNVGPKKKLMVGRPIDDRGLD